MGIQADQAAALIRAKEAADARTALGTVLSNEATGAGNMYATTLGGARAYGDLSQTGQGQQQGLNQSAAQGNAKTNEELATKGAGGLGNAISTAATM